ncbi:MAG: hypothetical protein M3Y82_05330 [Verrucomicrobiota bacterium]|nr:hypothetical protein [Verrucomicrobiota bacterium]
MKTFAQVVQLADKLSLEDQENLVSIVRRRLTEQRRAELIENVKAARLEHKLGRCRPASPKEIMKKILA